MTEDRWTKDNLDNRPFFFLQPLLFACFSKFMNPEHTPLPGLIQVWETKFMDFSRAIKKIIKKPTKQRKACFNNTGVGLKTARLGQRSWVRERARETNVYRSNMAEMPEGKRHRYCQNTLPEYCNLKL